MTTLETRSRTATASGEGAGRTREVGLGRLTWIELRKLADTRAGLWLLIVIALAAAGMVVAKLAAGVLIALLATALTLGLAALGTLLAGGHDWSLGVALLGRLALGQVLSVLVGLGFGALLLNSPLAIVAYFALPTVWSILGATIRVLRPAAGWLDLNATSMPLSEASMSGGQWARLGVSAAVWVLVPVVLGTVRVLKREVA
jgi:ABC-2 type transport system permease protein